MSHFSPASERPGSGNMFAIIDPTCGGLAPAHKQPQQPQPQQPQPQQPQAQQDPAPQQQLPPKQQAQPQQPVVQQPEYANTGTNRTPGQLVNRGVTVGP